MHILTFTMPEDINVSLVPDGDNEGNEAYQIEIHVQLLGIWRIVDGEGLKEMMKKGEIPSSSAHDVQEGLRCAVVLPLKAREIRIRLSA